MSHSRVSVLKPAGPNHCLIWFGSVHAANTRSRGALSTRHSTISRSRAQVLRGSLLIDVILRRGERVFEKALQSIKARFPCLARVVQPLLRLGKPVGPDVAGTLLAVAAAGNQARALKHIQVLRDRRQTHGER